MDIVKVQQGKHVDEVMTTLKYFAKTGIITDIALMAGKEPLHLHHIILSCFSNYFESLFAENVKYIINADARKTVLEALIDYIYKGIANISQKYKKQFLLAASSLQIEGFGSTNSHDFESSSKNDQVTIICPNHKLHLSQKIWEARQDASKSDVVFIINNKYKVFAHACILSACSPFLLQVFTGHCAEKRKPYIVALRNIRMDDLEFVLQFCYKGEINVPSQEIGSVYEVADLLGVDGLCKLLLTKIPTNLVVQVPEQEIQKCMTNIIRTSLKPVALAELLRYERMIDVHIFCKQKMFKAHSVILSIYSVFFKELANFLNYNLKDVIVLIESFNSKTIENLLEYIYVGEVKFEGNMEDFQANMSDWLDLNILPVSSEETPRTFTSSQSSNDESETKIDSAVCNDTVLKLKTESRRVVKDGKSKDSRQESSEKEEFENIPVHVKEKSITDEYDDLNKKNTQIPEHQNKQILYTITSNSLDCDENVPEDVREKIENSNRINKNDKCNASIIKHIPQRYMHTKVEIKNELIDLQCAPKSTENENSMIGERYATINCEDDLNIKENMNNNTYTQLVNKQIAIGNNFHCDNTMSLRPEKDDSEIDDPEKLESTIKSSSDELNNIKRSNPHVMAKKHKQRTFECQTCNSKFTARWEFKLHLLDHPDGNVRQCKLCLKEFSRPSELQNHLRTHTGARPMQCETCGMCFISKNTLRKHEHTHAKKINSEFECEICKKTFSRKQYLQEHKRTHSGSKPYECDVCHKSFVGKTGLNHHKKIHNSADEKKSAVCDICGKSFTRHALWTHIKHHNKEQKCEFCSKCFATTSALKLHVAGTHLGRSSHHCNTCGKGFLRKGHLSRHLKVHEGDKNVVIFACTQCPSKFKDESHLKAHVKRKHTQQSSISQTCGICGKHFSTQSTLIYHQRLHFHERPHRCNLCGKTFAMPYQLRDHTKLHHNDEKHFPCTVCNKKCATQALLNRHLLTHRPTFAPKIKPPGSFTCSYCDKIYPTKLALSNHSRTHNFSRPYQCNVCRKAFRYQDSLLKHLRLHSENVTSETTAKELPCIYTIQVCRPSFASVSSDMPESQNYASDPVPTEMLNSAPLTGTLTNGGNDSMCLNLSGKAGDDINLLQLKPVDDTFLNQTILQSEEVGFPSMQTIDTSSINSMSVEKTPDMTILPRRPYSITMDGNLCYNTALSTDGDITPSITLLPERTDLEISDMDVTMPSHVLLPVTHSTSMVELSQLAVSLPSQQTTHEFDSSQTKDYSL